MVKDHYTPTMYQIGMTKKIDFSLNRKTKTYS